MVGITLSPEQIRAAPPQVRHWLEQEIATALGLSVAEPASHAEPPHLVACSAEEAGAIFSLIQGMLPVANVFFELGRETGRRLPNGLHAFGLLDVQSHTQLSSPEQVLSCLETINRALRQVCGDTRATLYGRDDRANCFVAELTHQSVRQLWQHLISSRGAGEPVRGEAAPHAFPAGQPSAPAPDGASGP